MSPFTGKSDPFENLPPEEQSRVKDRLLEIMVQQQEDKNMSEIVDFIQKRQRARKKKRESLEATIKRWGKLLKTVKTITSDFKELLSKCKFANLEAMITEDLQKEGFSLQNNSIFTTLISGLQLIRKKFKELESEDADIRKVRAQEKQQELHPAFYIFDTVMEDSFKAYQLHSRLFQIQCQATPELRLCFDVHKNAIVFLDLNEKKNQELFHKNKIDCSWRTWFTGIMTWKEFEESNRDKKFGDNYSGFVVLGAFSFPMHKLSPSLTNKEGVSITVGAGGVLASLRIIHCAESKKTTTKLSSSPFWIIFESLHRLGYVLSLTIVEGIKTLGLQKREKAGENGMFSLWFPGEKQLEIISVAEGFVTGDDDDIPKSKQEEEEEIEKAKIEEYFINAYLNKK